eukprot:TRINITY_DN43304_c0_g1_i1.p1 TRINITY_DN43304_c0_g1~~TRINITY_DN43304_c0_g1_i1.p1  ORF type:complete len:338 (-),score=67.34 TRINITY_DN43304_c0_g1_i1:164-1177(-)
MLLKSMAPADAKEWILRVARWGWLPTDYEKDDPYLVSEPFEGFKLASPLGLAGGFDREAASPNGFIKLGFGFVEVGPLRPPDADSGSQAAEVDRVARRLAARDRTGQLVHYGQVGATVPASYGQKGLLEVVDKLGDHVSYLAIQVDKPGSTAQMASPDAVRRSLAFIIDAAARLPGGGPRVFLRIPKTWLEASGKGPAEQAAAVSALASAAQQAGADAVIICAPTDSDGHASHDELAALLGAAYQATHGELNLIACHGASSGLEALRLLEAGAMAVQVSEPLLTGGLQMVRRLKNEMSQALVAEGYYNISEVIGAAHRKKPKTKAKKNIWKKGNVGR